MSLKDEITQVLYEVVDDINKDLPSDQQLAKSTDTIIYGQNGRLDSLGMVGFVVATEKKIEERFNVLITLSSVRAMSQRSSPYRSISAFADHLTELIGASKNV